MAREDGGATERIMGIVCPLAMNEWRDVTYCACRVELKKVNGTRRDDRTEPGDVYRKWSPTSRFNCCSPSIADLPLTEFSTVPTRGTRG